MRWIGGKLLAGSMTLLGGVLLAGAAPAFSLGAADAGERLERVWPNRQLELSRIALYRESANEAELAFRHLISTVEPNPLGIGWKIAERWTRNPAAGEDELDPTSFPSLRTISMFDGVRFSTAALRHGGRFLCESNPGTLVPEPGTLGLLGGGLFGFGLLARRPRRRPDFVRRRGLEREALRRG